MAKRRVALTRFGENVRALREKRELTQVRLSELAELDQTNISGIENGDRKTTRRSFRRITPAKLLLSVFAGEPEVCRAPTTCF